METSKCSFCWYFISFKWRQSLCFDGFRIDLVVATKNRDLSTFKKMCRDFSARSYLCLFVLSMFFHVFRWRNIGQPTQATASEALQLPYYRIGSHGWPRAINFDEVFSIAGSRKGKEEGDDAWLGWFLRRRWWWWRYPTSNMVSMMFHVTPLNQ